MKGSSVGAMAWRNLWRNRRRTVLTLSSIAFGVVLAILFTGIGDSNWREMIDLAARMGGGHVTIQHPEYQDSPTFSKAVGDATALRELALVDPDVERVVLRISGNLMLMSAGESRGAGFIAYDPADEDTQSLSLLDALVEGEWFASSHDKGIILGRQLAKNLDVALGRKVVFTLTDRNGDIVQEAARVTGIIATGGPTVDGSLAMLPLGRVREALRFGPDEVTQVALFVDDQRRVDTVADRIGAQLGGGVVALPWHDVQPDLSSFIAMKVASAQFMEVVIMLLVAAGIFNTIFVSVMERLREFGIMLAVGFSPAKLFGLVMCESLWLALCGIALALAVGAWPYYYLNTKGVDLTNVVPSGSEVVGIAMTMIMRADIYFENGLAIVVAALVATLLAGLYPAWSAGRVEPVESIRVG